MGGRDGNREGVDIKRKEIGCTYIQNTKSAGRQEAGRDGLS